MKSSLNNHLLFLILLLIPLSVKSQAYFKRLDRPEKFFTQKVTHFSNGDLLVGNSNVEAVLSGSGGSIYLTRFDPCGNVVWSQAYEREIEYLEFKDFIITPTNEILVYGSAYEGLDELIFLMKLSGKGDLIKFVLYETGTVDHFTYNMDLQGNLLMIYGLILHFGSKKHGFITTFDENLNYQWSKKFTPFESIGAAYITRNESFICRFGDNITKLDQDGGLDWGLSVVRNNGNGLIAGPLEVTNGYILEAYGEAYAFFYKLDLSGNLVWKSPRFPSTSYGADMQILPDGNLLAVYSSVVNHDGLLDILLVGNDFGMEVQQGRADAFAGLVLINEGDWNFRPLSIEESHFMVAGDARALVSVLFQENQELILASQHKDSLKVFAARDASPQQYIRLQAGEVKAVSHFSDGQQQLDEFYWGSGFMSQTGRYVVKTDAVDKIELLDNKGVVNRVITKNQIQ